MYSFSFNFNFSQRNGVAAPRNNSNDGAVCHKMAAGATAHSNAFDSRAYLYVLTLDVQLVNLNAYNSTLSNTSKNKNTTKTDDKTN